LARKVIGCLGPSSIGIGRTASSGVERAADIVL
jgi:hypothetical protein